MLWSGGVNGPLVKASGGSSVIIPERPHGPLLGLCSSSYDGILWLTSSALSAMRMMYTPIASKQ